MVERDADRMRERILDLVSSNPGISHGVLVNRIRHKKPSVTDAAIASLVSSGELLATECGSAKGRKPTTKYVVVDKAA